MLDINKLFGNIKLTKIEESILTYLVNNIDSCINEGVREIAKKNFTSPSTIIRLSKKLGYSGFVELMYSLKNKLSFENRDDYFNSINERNIFSTNYDNAVDDFLGYINDGKILISGEGFSEIVSKYFYMKLLVLGKKCILSTFIDLDVIFDNNMDTVNSVILISKSGESNHSIKSCMHAKERNLKVICFTGNGESTLAKNADIIFLIPDCEKLDNDNYYPNPFFAYCIESFELMIHRFLNSK